MSAVLIMGARGKDFHTFNVIFKDNPQYHVVCFTVCAEQNLSTAQETTADKDVGRYPPELAGPLYPDGIPIYSDAHLEELIKSNQVQEVVFAYSDVAHEELMHKASMVLAAGANWRLIAPSNTYIKPSKPLLAVCAVRTGCGKSQVSRLACRFFKQQGLRVVAIREPMPYGDLVKEKVMRLQTYDDLDRFGCTMEEREEYEPYIEQGLVVYAGVDYAAILQQAEAEADVLVWDGGNNEVCFYKPDLLLVVCDPLRPNSEKNYFPGEVNARAADVLIINKMNALEDPSQANPLISNLTKVNPLAPIIKTNSVVSCDSKARDLIKGRRCLVLEDGPTTTHGDMSYGAGMAAVVKYGGTAVEPNRALLRGSLVDVFKNFPHLTRVVPAMGYTDQQRGDLLDSLNAMAATCDVVVNGSPLNVERLLPGLLKPVARVTYDITDYREGDADTLEAVLAAFVQRHQRLPKRGAGAGGAGSKSGGGGACASSGAGAKSGAGAGGDRA